MAIQIKFCPRCKFAASLQEPVCSNCGHRFRTQFVPLPGTAPEPTTTMPAAPCAPSFVNITVLKECTAQYHRYTYWRIICALTTPALMGLWMAFHIDRQEMELRHRVASLGVDAAQWEQSLRPARYRAFRNAFVIFLAVILGLMFLSILVASARPSYPASDPEGAYYEPQRTSEWRPDRPQTPPYYCDL
ncbi:MAG: hypothetical protein RMJ43_07520 [Chloroherpetonaceae bacterium]|nr:hypothetical protein [Chthonomonadaceae bacterium]MDW8207670.1 hypothetical protein [Chloroherpetonaceae bacterium]